jgi:hypothetical protein
MSEKKSSATVSKKTYKVFCELLKSKVTDVEMLTMVLDTFKEAFVFDPEKSSYDCHKAQQIKAYRGRKKAEGISTYISSGVKGSYYKRKQEIEV